MQINIENNAGMCRITVEGEMTIYNAAQLKDELIPTIAMCEKVEINLAGVSEIDAAGLQILALVKREAAAMAKQLDIVAHSKALLEILDLCNLAGVFGDQLVISKPE